MNTNSLEVPAGISNEVPSGISVPSPSNVAFETSRSISQVIAALKGFSDDCPVITKEGFNDHFKSRYADLADIIRATTPALSKNGLVVTQLLVSFTETTRSLISILAHTSGEFIRTTILLSPVQNTPQGFGSATTYARRYAMQALLNLCIDEDDDGNAASGNGAAADPIKQRSEAKKQQAPPTVVPKTPEEIEKMRVQVAAAPLEKIGTFSQAITLNLSQEKISAEIATELMLMLYKRWLFISPVGDAMAIGQAFVRLVGEGVFSTDQQATFMAAIEEKLQAK